MAMRFLACPGQGSQTVGFLTPWIELVPGFTEQLLSLGKAASRDLVWLGTEASEETIKDTANAQPLIVGAAIAAARTLFSETSFDGVIGHSVGEFAAAAISGVISDEDAMRLVTVRAEAMAEAAKKVKTSMAAVLGGEEAEVLERLQVLGLSAANYNGAGQIVAAGEKSSIEHLLQEPPQKSRVIELKVAGAFHTHFMESAVSTLAAAAAGVTPKDPTVQLFSNQDGQRVRSGAEFLELMVKQVANPVRWDKCMDSLDAMAVELIELPPAGALAGLAKRGMPNSQAVALRVPSDREKIGI
jgi:[acyl-carrier-protein] S-malonyltransferase